MLEAIPRQHFESAVFRYANQARHIDLLTEMGLDPAGIEEMTALLRDRGLVENPGEFLDAPFAAKLFLRPTRTRFSDGTTRIFYSALEPETAEAEVLYWYMQSLISGTQSKRVFYRRVRCQFGGQVNDLRAKAEDWPFLVADDGYDECNKIGAEAHASGIDGLLTLSARRSEGTNLPVFQRVGLSGVALEGYRVFEFDPATNGVMSRDA